MVEEKEENGFNSILQCASTSEPHRTVEDPVNTPRSHLFRGCLQFCPNFAQSDRTGAHFMTP